ncbi:MAG: nucleotide exchange factor GrpE [Bacteroidetes bacterium]|nr:MAG: nucleotide exchange factor GrpE [Bacteroidota bacterium]
MAKQETNKQESEVKGAAKKATKTSSKTESKKTTHKKSVKKEKKAKVEKKDEKQELLEKYEIANDKYMRLAAEFDNYRKRTLKERMDIIKSAGEDIIINILPVVDDFERALDSMENAEDIVAVKEGINIIYNKLIDYLKSRGVKEVDAMNKEFDTDIHEAVTKIPAPDKKLKGKVVDVVSKGYYLNDKIIRFPKVVIGE